MKSYNKSNLTLAKNLRKNMTPQERKLWYTFLKSHPLKFYRQKPISDFIADFYCAQARLVIEIDGGGHYKEEQLMKDRIRTQKLNELGLTIIRFTNSDVDKNFDDVCSYINLVIKGLLKK